MRDHPKQKGMRIGETRKAWLDGQLDMMVDTDATITIERKGPQNFTFSFLAVGHTWGLFADWYNYTGCTMREAQRRFREDYGLIGAHLNFEIVG